MFRKVIPLALKLWARIKAYCQKLLEKLR